MRKLFALICCLFISPAIANIHIEPEILESVLQEYMPDTDSRLAAYREYNSQLKTANGAGIPAAGVWYVCNAAGWDIKQSSGKDKCTKFTETLIERATWSFKAVCGDDKKMIGARTGRCIDNFFSNKVAGGTRVNMLIATGLAKEYARVKFNDDSLICNKEARTNKVDDFVQCLSVKQNMAYEFKFDSVTASIDVTITEGTESAICRMYDTKYIISGHEGDRANYHYWRAACDTANKNLCEKINNSMERFGRSAKIGKTGPRSNERDACVIKTEKSASNLRTAFGIDNYVFKNGGVQLQATSGLTEQLCTYIRNNVTDPKITSCKCDDGYTQIYDFSGIVTETDDVLTCYANNQPIDFVFDDLSEHNKTIAKGGLESFNCTVLGGEYQGKTCYTPDKDLCDKIAAATLSECPECAKAYYDEKLKSCVLPNSTNAVQKQKRTNTYLIIGGTLVGAAVVIYTGGTGAVYVAMAVETVGGAMELISQHHIDGVADEFFVKANNCNDATCAESILKEFFQYLSRMTNDLDSSELSGIDTQMARLIGLLPDDSQFMTDVVGACYEKNNVNNDNFNIVACDDGIWNPDQIVRAVGIALQFTSVFASVGKWVLGAGRVQKIAKQTPKLTNALQHKISGVKDVVAKKLAQGKSVKLSNGKNIATKAKTATKTPATTTTSAVAKTETATSPKTFDIAEDGTISMLSSGRQVIDEVDEVTEYERLLSIIRNEDLSPEELAKAEARVKELEAKGVTLPENNAVGSAMQKIKAKTAGQTSNNDILRERMAQFAKNNGDTPAAVSEANNNVMGGVANMTDEERMSTRDRIYAKRNEVAFANMVNYDELSDIDKKWYDLWIEYAPKNQTFDEFKASANGDLDKMKKMTKTMTPRSEQVRVAQEYNAQLTAKAEQLREEQKALIEETHTLRTNEEDYIIMDDGIWVPKYPEDAKRAQEIIKRRAQISDELKAIDEALPVEDYSNYSTVDRSMSKRFKEFNQKESELQNRLNAESTKKYEEFVKNGGTGGYRETEDFKKLHQEYISEREKLAQEYQTSQWDIAEDFQLKNLGNVEKERVEMFKDVLNNNRELKSKLRHDVWVNLTEQEKTNVLQQIVDELAVKFGTPKAEISIFEFDKDIDHLGGAFISGTHKIMFNTKYINDFTPDNIADMLSHEYSHLIDYWTPNEGALGSQYDYYAGKIYSNYKENGYDVSLREQSSYAIGSDVGAMFKMTNPWMYVNNIDDIAKQSYGIEKLSGFVENSKYGVYSTVSAGQAAYVFKPTDDMIDNMDAIQKILDEHNNKYVRSFWGDPENVHKFEFTIWQDADGDYLIGTNGFRESDEYAALVQERKRQEYADLIKNKKSERQASIVEESEEPMTTSQKAAWGAVGVLSGVNGGVWGKTLVDNIKTKKEEKNKQQEKEQK